MVALKVSALLVALVAQCWTAPLEVLVNGANDTGTGFCVGDNVVFTCRVPTLTHAWNVSGFIQSISPVNMDPIVAGPDNMFTFELVASLTDRLISSFSLVIYSGFDGASIACFDALLQINDRETSIALLGIPPAPTISATASDDFMSFDVTLTTAGPSARCVLQYSLSITENGQITTTVTINSNGTSSVGGLNLCRSTYSFTAVAVTEVVSSSSSASVTGWVDFSNVSQLSGVRVDNGVVQWTISSSLPGECYGKYLLQLSQCKIEAFAILPVLNLDGDSVRTIFASISIAAPPTTSMAALNSTYYWSVGVDDCVKSTFQTSISPANISGRLVLSSIEASSSTCNISLMSESVTSTSSQMTDCNGTDATTEPGPEVIDDGIERGIKVALIGSILGGISAVIVLILIPIKKAVAILLSKKASKRVRLKDGV